MVLAPSGAKRLDVICKVPPNITYLLDGEAIAFLEPNLIQITHQVKFGMRICSDNMDMRRGMIVEINHDPQATEAQDGGHPMILPKNA